MSHATLDPRSTRGMLVVASLCGLVLIPAVLAQQRMMVFESDDAAPPQLLHVTGPDLAELRQPDYLRRDLPIFTDKLRLDEVQQLVVGTLLDTYLAAFRQLLEDSMQAMMPPGMGMLVGGDPDAIHDGEAHGEHGEGRTIGELVHEALEEARAGQGTVTDYEVDVRGDSEGAVAIAIRAGGGGEEGEGSPMPELEGERVHVWAGTVVGPDGQESPEAGVVIAMQTPEGVEIPEELRERLEQKAQELAERVEQRLAELEAEGLAPEDLVPAGGVEEHRQRIEEARQAAEKFARSKEALTETFLGEVRTQLTAEQLGRWPAFERAVTRVKTLPRGRLDGERTNLLTVFESVQVPAEDRETAAGTLESYEIDLDRALRERNEFLGEANRKLDEHMTAGEFRQAVRVAEDAARLRVAVRSVNERYAEAIAAKLTPDAGTAFRAAARKASYPRVYRRTRLDRSFEAVRAMDGIGPDALAGIEEIERAYRTEVDLLNERIRETIRREQPREARRMIERVESVMQGEPGAELRFDAADDPVRAALQKRRALDERYLKQLHALLTPEQIEALPAPRSRVIGKSS